MRYVILNIVVNFSLREQSEQYFRCKLVNNVCLVLPEPLLCWRRTNSGSTSCPPTSRTRRRVPRRVPVQPAFVCRPASWSRSPLSRASFVCSSGCTGDHRTASHGVSCKHRPTVTNGRHLLHQRPTTTASHKTDGLSIRPHQPCPLIIRVLCLDGSLVKYCHKCSAVLVGQE